MTRDDGVDTGNRRGYLPEGAIAIPDQRRAQLPGRIGRRPSRTFAKSHEVIPAVETGGQPGVDHADDCQRPRHGQCKRETSGEASEAQCFPRVASGQFAKPAAAVAIRPEFPVPLPLGAGETEKIEHHLLVVAAHSEKPGFVDQSHAADGVRAPVDEVAHADDPVTGGVERGRLQFATQ